MTAASPTARGGARSSGPGRASSRAAGLVLASLFGLQAGGALATTLYATVGVTGAVTLRLCLAATVLLLLRRPSLRLTARQWALVAALGAVLCTHHLGFYAAISRIPLGTATTVEFLGPFLVGAWFSRTRTHLLTACAAFAGVVVLSGPSLESDAVGLALAGVAGAAWAAYILLARTLAQHETGGAGLALAMTVGGLVSLPVGLPDLVGGLGDPAVLATGAAVAVLSSVVPYTLQLRALRDLRPRVFSVLLSTEPAVAAIIGLAALGQQLSAVQWLGIGVVVLAAATAASRS